MCNFHFFLDGSGTLETDLVLQVTILRQLPLLDKRAHALAPELHIFLGSISRVFLLERSKLKAVSQHGWAIHMMVSGV